MFCPVSLQSPPSMKAVLQAGWLMTVAFGNLIVVIIAGADTISDQVNIAEKMCTEFIESVGEVTPPPKNNFS